MGTQPQQATISPAEAPRGVPEHSHDVTLVVAKNLARRNLAAT
jgi:hypothetical protein